MSQLDVMPELKEIIGALIFGANRPLGSAEIMKCLQEVAQTVGGETTAFGGVSEADVNAALAELKAKVAQERCGFVLAEVAGGFRYGSAPNCGNWLKHLLNTRPSRLSQPSLETLAIIAYRQPISKADIESIRGVGVDHMMKTLLELQLVKIVGRSELPGRPFLYGTTHAFLEHFGLKDLKDLDQMEPMLLAAKERAKMQAEANAQAQAELKPQEQAPAPQENPQAAETSVPSDPAGPVPEPEAKVEAPAPVQQEVIHQELEEETTE